MEQWKTIKGFEGFYEISDHGNIRSLDRCVIRSDGRKRTCKGINLNGSTNPQGYNIIMLYKDAKYKAMTIHRLIALHFIPNPKNKPCINHKNGIRTDNRIENLEWCTYSENNKHSYRVLKNINPMTGKLGIKHHGIKIVIKKDLQGNFIRKYYGCHEAERDTGIDFSCIARACRAEKEYKNYSWSYSKEMSI